MKKPPITIKCECGETKDVAYGQRWLCDVCQRSWNTQQIPQEEYDGLLRRVRRHQLEVLAAAGLMAAVFVPLIVVVSSGFIYLIPIVMVFWLFVLLPFWRRRYRRTARSAPRWELHPE
jgi:Flp pilus assembly protein TadB